jgi:hypothetical protein
MLFSPRRFLASVVLSATLLSASSKAAAATCGVDEAGAFYKQARKAFDEKRFDDSIALLRQANACDPNPVYFANIARALEEANRPKEAQAAWRAYQEVVTDPKERSRAQGRISSLQPAVDQIDAQEKQKAADEQRKRDEVNAAAAARDKKPAPLETQPPPPTKSPSIPAIVVTGIGLVGIGVGVGLGLTASSKHDDAVAEPDVKKAAATQSDAVDLGHAANVAIIAGSVVAAGGIVWLGIDWFSSSSSPKSSTKLGVTPRGLALSGTF